MENNYYFESFDGKKIYIHEWVVDNPIGVVQIVHGMAEHGGRYDLLAKHLNQQGYLVFANDHRAHGKTDENTLGYCSGNIWEDTLKDIKLINEYYKKKFFDLKYVIIGHSYGSFLMQAYITRYDGIKENLFDGVILSGSAKMDGIDVKLGKIIASVGKGNSPAHLIKKMSFDAYNKKFKEGIFVSSLIDECERYQKDPFCNFVCSKNFYKNFFNGLTKLYKKEALQKINRNLPMLLISGEQDPVGGFKKSITKLYQMYLKLGVKNVELVSYPNNRHEVINDISRNEAYKAITDFLNSVRLLKQ